MLNLVSTHPAIKRDFEELGPLVFIHKNKVQELQVGDK